MNKSLLTNLLAALLVLLGISLPWEPWSGLLLSTGLFALSGAVTNWLAIYMLFERVPGLYGSGVIPARFEEFKAGIRQMVMSQFFNQENIDRFFSRLEQDAEQGKRFTGLDKLIEKIDLNGAFESLLDVIMKSSFASMLSMLGGRSALEGLRGPFIDKMRDYLAKLGTNTEVLEQVREATTRSMLEKVEQIVEQRLDELTPEMVKQLIQEMMRRHLGWLVVWGGVFGGLIGLLSSSFLLYF